MSPADANRFTFDLFYDDSFEPLLIASFGHLEDAKNSMEHFASRVPGPYFVWASGEDEVMAQLNAAAPKRATRL